MTSNRDREASVERLLRQALLADQRTEASAECLDAETLAAWADGTLSNEAVAAAEVHVADCSRCLALVSALTQSTPVDERAESWWRRLGPMRWLVPLAAATAVALWVAVPSGPRPAVTELAQAEAPAAPVVPPAQESPAQPGESGARAAADLDTLGLADGQAAEANEVDRLAPSARVQGQGSLASSAREDEQLAERFDDTPRRERAATSPPEDLAEEAGTRGNDELSDLARRSLASPEENVAPPAAVAVAVARQAPAGAGAAQPEFASADASMSWRVGAAGSIERSADGGASWERLVSGVTANLTAGVSPSSLVCWVVGRNGTVLLTTDGETWRRLTFPEPVDLTAVRATDARRAAVTTADGRTFTTADGGRTWDR